MTSKRRKYLLWGTGIILSLLTVSTPGFAALDTSSGPVICAFTKGFECDNKGGCQETSPDSIGLPAFIELDMANNKVTTAAGQETGERRETAIKTLQEEDNKLILQGIERRGWNAVIDKATGHMTVAASSDREAIVFFGRCTKP